jgi:ABC-type multidrug transport system ATPase subunit
LSGYPYQLPEIPVWVQDCANLCPMKWMFQGLMVWKFSHDCIDGEAYLEPFGMEGASQYDSSLYLGMFLFVPGTIFLVSLLPMPSRLWYQARGNAQEKNGRSYSRDSFGSFDGEGRSGIDGPRKQAPLLAPLVFARESSVASEVSLCIAVSNTGEEVSSVGCNINFSDINYTVPDKGASSGKRNVLSNCNGMFTWGRLSVIMGSTGSGKSSLLHVLAGAIPVGEELTGSIKYNGALLDTKASPLWQRCALIEVEDIFLRDLTVLESVTYSMELRCRNMLGVKFIEENVTRVMSLLELDKLADVRTKFLDKGAQRRLSIAVEIVHGPRLIMIDEPTTGLPIKDVVLIMKVIRELVNQDRTVICAVHEPSASQFELFDQVLLLCHGRIIFHGRAAQAIDYFKNSPFNFAIPKDENPAKFLLELSAGQVTAQDGTFASPAALEDYMKSSVTKKRISIHSAKKSGGSNDLQKAVAAVRNPLNKSLNESQEGEVVETEKSDIKIDHPDFRTNLMKARVIFMRSLRNTFCRRKLVIGSFAAHLLIAFFLGIVLGPQHESNVYNITSFFVIGALLCILVSIQQAFFMHKVNEVFLREREQGLYNTFIYWLLGSLPIYILRVFNAILYSVVAYAMLDLSPSLQGYYLLQMIICCVTGLVLCEAVCVAVPDVRSAYLTLPVVSMVMFFFSGLPVKPATLPDWVGPWGPSISLIRWVSQSLVLNEFDGQTCSPAVTGETCTFPEVQIQGGAVTIKTYSAFKTLFGWGGKTKYFCLEMVVINLIIFKILVLILLYVKPYLNRWRRHLRKVTKEEALTADFFK